MSFRLSLAHLGMLDAPPPVLVEAAHAAGFGGVGIRLNPARPGEQPFPMEEGGAMLRETRARVRDLGMTVHDIEIVRIGPAFDVKALDGVLASAQALGARRLMVNVDDAQLMRAARAIGLLAARASSHGLTLGLEFMVYTAARSLRVARELADASGSEAVRVVVDALHFFRAGCTPDDMTGARIDLGFMQINDAPVLRHPGLSPAEEGRAHRLFPGEGGLPVHRLLPHLTEGAVLSVEAPSAIRMATLDVHARAVAAYRATRIFLQDTAMATNETLDGLRLDGSTAVLVIIGDPIAQVKAPLPLTQLLQARGINAVLVPLHVQGDDVPALLRALQAVRNVAGIVVTVPHKQRVAGLGGELLPAAREALAVNVIRRGAGGWQGDLLDGAGFLAGLVRNGFDVRGRSAGLVGAGGAGHAIAFALAGAGAASIDVHDADEAKCAALIERLRALGHTAARWDAASPRDLVVNATPMGMKEGDPLPVALSAMQPGCTVAEVVMEPPTTPLLVQARNLGARTVQGRHMMNEQLEAMADFFFGQVPR